MFIAQRKRILWNSGGEKKKRIYTIYYKYEKINRYCPTTDDLNNWKRARDPRLDNR